MRSQGLLCGISPPTHSQDWVILPQTLIYKLAELMNDVLNSFAKKKNVNKVRFNLFALLALSHSEDLILKYRSVLRMFCNYKPIRKIIQEE